MSVAERVRAIRISLSALKSYELGVKRDQFPDFDRPRRHEFRRDSSDMWRMTSPDRFPCFVEGLDTESLWKTKRFWYRLEGIELTGRELLDEMDDVMVEISHALKNVEVLKPKNQSQLGTVILLKRRFQWNGTVSLVRIVDEGERSRLAILASGYEIRIDSASDILSGIPRELSDLQKHRSQYQPELPPCLQGTTVIVELGDSTTATDPSSVHAISRSFPHTYGQPLAHFIRKSANVPDAQVIADLPAIRVGLVFCGRQSPGGHNVIWGLHDALKVHNPNSKLLGFPGGSEGLFAQKTLEITDDILATYKNQGGYDLLGGTKDQIRTSQQVNAAMAACKALKLDGLVVIGGVTLNTDAAQLAETFAEAKCPTKVVGVPVTSNGDLKNQFVEANVGFDTICKVNAHLISNVCTDALSTEKYYYFIRLMGRKASHVALECTLQSHPNMLILGEEVAGSKLTLFDITTQICNAVKDRATQDKNHGVIVLPEGLIESIPDVYALLQEIHSLRRQGVSADKISSQLSPWASALYKFLPPFIRKQLLLFPESDDSAQLSQIETEKLLAHLVETELNKQLEKGTYQGKKLNAICHFFGYHARGSLPSKFDCDYAYVLGHVCYHILAAGLNGYMATITNLKNPVSKWRCGAAPITAMMTVKRYGRGAGALSPGKPALHPATVDLKGKSYELLGLIAKKFLLDDIYRNQGPLQFDGPDADSKAISLFLEDQDYLGSIKQLQEYVDKVRTIVKPGCSQEVLEAALSAMSSVTEILSVMSSASSSVNTLF